MRKHYERSDLANGVRGKYFSAYRRGTNLVLLRPEVVAAFPTSEDVNEALLGLMKVAKSAGLTTRSGRRGRDKVQRDSGS